MTAYQFQQRILQGIPSELPQPKVYESTINHAPNRKSLLNQKTEILLINNKPQNC